MLRALEGVVAATTQLFLFIFLLLPRFSFIVLFFLVSDLSLLFLLFLATLLSISPGFSFWAEIEGGCKDQETLDFPLETQHLLLVTFITWSVPGLFPELLSPSTSEERSPL